MWTQENEPAPDLLGEFLLDHRAKLAADLLASAPDAGGEIMLEWRRRNDGLPVVPLAWRRHAQKLGVEPMAQIKHRPLEQARVELADSACEQSQQALADLGGVENDLAKDGRRHEEKLGVGQRGDIGRALRAVDGRHFSKKLAWTEISEDHLLPRRRTDKDANVA